MYIFGHLTFLNAKLGFFIPGIFSCLILLIVSFHTFLLFFLLELLDVGLLELAV